MFKSLCFVNYLYIKLYLLRTTSQITYRTSPTVPNPSFVSLTWSLIMIARKYEVGCDKSKNGADDDEDHAKNIHSLPIKI